MVFHNFYRDYVGCCKDCNGVDGDAGSVGGFVFNKYYCGATGCSSGTLSGSDIIKFENSQWISTMAKLTILYSCKRFTCLE